MKQVPSWFKRGTLVKYVGSRVEGYADKPCILGDIVAGTDEYFGYLESIDYQFGDSGRKLWAFLVSADEVKPI